MGMTVPLNPPPDLEQRLLAQASDIDAQIKEAFLPERSLRGQISHDEPPRAPGLDRFETDAHLKRHKVLEGSLTTADPEAGYRTLEQPPSKGR